MWGVMVRYDNGAYLDTLWKSLEELEEETAEAEKEGAFRQFDRTVSDLFRLGCSSQEVRSRVTVLGRTARRKKNGARK
jgi:hypothetical protein